MSYEKLEVTKGLMEAYVAMHSPQEESQENLVEEVQDLHEIPVGNTADYKARQAAQQRAARQALQSGQSLRAGGLFGRSEVSLDSAATRRTGRSTLRVNNQNSTAMIDPTIKIGGKTYDRLTTKGKGPFDATRQYVERKPATSPTPTPPVRDNNTRNNTGGTGETRRPAVPPAVKTAPAAPAGQTGDKAKDMATWAKANPTLAAAAAEKARIRGTQQTDNPLMKDMKSRLPMNSPSVQSPDIAKLASKPTTLAGNQSLVNNPNAFKAATSTQATAATTKPVAPEVKTTNTAAANPNTGKTELKPGVQKSDVDLFDLVKGHLLDEGYAETEEAALKIMANMSEEWRQEILDEAKYGTEAGRKALAKKVRKGENIGKKGPGTGFKVVEKAAKAGGAEDPTAVAAAAMWKTYGKGKSKKEC